ncbi:MAG: hypothetical protein ABI080_18055 [Candidatus Binatia bacterium]
MIAAVSGFGLASVPAFGVLRSNTWLESGEPFRLGYVIGYIDAVQLAQRKDVRVQLPTGGGKNYDRWVRDVTAFYANPVNKGRGVPDAMYEVGAVVRAEWLKDFAARNAERKAAAAGEAAKAPSPSPAP